MTSNRHKMRSIPEDRLEALLAENIRLRSTANKIWLKPWFVPMLFGGAFIFAFAGAFIGAS